MEPSETFHPPPSIHKHTHTHTNTHIDLRLARIETRIRDLEAAVISTGGNIPRREKRRLIADPETGEEEATDYVVSTNDSTFLPEKRISIVCNVIFRALHHNVVFRRNSSSTSMCPGF